ncbi:MAG: hypothetical protein IPM32_14425 [Ignavibacteriae bacterium]|nr:hypothetical protein [Ignavibacteriota bacterium]
MKGKNIFTKSEIAELRSLIQKRIRANRSEQKSIRNKMRTIGFYGKDDFNVIDMQPIDFENLILSGRIKILNGSITKETKFKSEDIIPFKKIKTISEKNSSEIDLKKFIRFNPLLDSDKIIPNAPGNYIICLNTNSYLPEIGLTCETNTFNKLVVIYTGIASRSLRTRDFRQHFCGNNAGRSTLRKSIGAMFKYKQVPRDKDPNNGKTKFSESDEVKLSEWMKKNLTLFYQQNDCPDSYEEFLIAKLNPPLNLDKNKTTVNQTFRKELSRLRNIK